MQTIFLMVDGRRQLRLAGQDRRRQRGRLRRNGGFLSPQAGRSIIRIGHRLIQLRSLYYLPRRLRLGPQATQIIRNYGIEAQTMAL
jgi:hypothetical protein